MTNYYYNKFFEPATKQIALNLKFWGEELDGFKPEETNMNMNNTVHVYMYESRVSY